MVKAGAAETAAAMRRCCQCCCAIVAPPTACSRASVACIPAIPLTGESRAFPGRDVLSPLNITRPGLSVVVGHTVHKAHRTYGTYGAHRQTAPLPSANLDGERAAHASRSSESGAGRLFHEGAGLGGRLAALLRRGA